MSYPFGDDDVDFDVEKLLESSYKNAIALINNERPSLGRRFTKGMDNPLIDGKDHFHVKPSLANRRNTALFSVDGVANLFEDPTKAGSMISATAADATEWLAETALTPGLAPASALSPATAPAPEAKYQLERLERARNQTQYRSATDDGLVIDAVLQYTEAGATPLAQRLKATDERNRSWGSANGTGDYRSPASGRSPICRSGGRSPTSSMPHGEVYEPQYRAVCVTSPSSPRAGSSRGGAVITAEAVAHADEAVAKAAKELALARAAKPPPPQPLPGQVPPPATNGGGFKPISAISGVFKAPGKK